MRKKTSVTQSLDDIISIAVKLAKDLKADSQKQKEISTICHGRTKEEKKSESPDDQVKQTKKQNELKVNMISSKGKIIVHCSLHIFVAFCFQ